jgi:DNA-binding transcriptional regulator PaaX
MPCVYVRASINVENDMGKLEKEARADRRKGYLQNAVLTTVAIGGVLALTMIAPNTLQLLGGFGRKKRFGEQAKRAATRLADNGCVRFVEVRGKKHLEITEKGRRMLEAAERTARLRSGPPKPKRWDKRWRMIVFDIPERRKRTRERLRDTVRSLGFLRLQDSVWVYPYDCEDLVVLLKSELRIGRDVLYAIVERIENDGWIRKHFGV